MTDWPFAPRSWRLDTACFSLFRGNDDAGGGVIPVTKRSLDTAWCAGMTEGEGNDGASVGDESGRSVPLNFGAQAEAGADYASAGRSARQA